MLKLPRPPTPRRIPQLKRPQEITRLLEIWPHGIDLMDQVLHTNDPKFAQMFFDDGIIGQGDALFCAQFVADFAIASLVD